MNETATIERAEALMAEGRLDEAVTLTQALIAVPHPTHLALAVHSGALKLAGRSHDALVFDKQGIERFGDSPIAWHNYAATLDDLGRAAEAVEACETAFRKGMDAQQTFAVYARALRAVGNHERAEYAYKQSMIRAPGVTGVAVEYANYVWMRRGDVAEADAVLDIAFHGGSPPAPLLVAKATLYDAAGQTERAVKMLDIAGQRMPGNTEVLMAATDFALRLEQIDEAQRFIRLAEAAEPGSRNVIQYSAIVDLAHGRGDIALAKLNGELSKVPTDGSLLGWAAMAARMVGDPLYEQLYDYDGMVAAYDLAPPAGWPSLETYLRDLRKALEVLHPYGEHPTNQSLRHGSQTMHLLTGSDDPAIKAFFQAVDAPIREHMARLGTAPDPLRRRNTFDYKTMGAWSVRLKPGGFHRDHYHPAGWLSSAFYVETPDQALESAEKQGWIRFGHSPFVTNPPMPPARYIKPKAGRLVLFPSYMWHGTEPFTTDEVRMSIAFDLEPK